MRTVMWFCNFSDCIYFVFYCYTYLSDKDPKEQQCDVPCEEQEAGTDPQMVEQGEVQQSSYAVKRVDRAGDPTQTHSFSALK